MSGPTVQSIEELARTAADELQEINTQESLQEWRVAYLGRRGRLTVLLRGLSQLDLEQRREAGKQANRPSKIWNNG